MKGISGPLPEGMTYDLNFRDIVSCKGLASCREGTWPFPGQQTAEPVRGNIIRRTGRKVAESCHRLGEWTNSQAGEIWIGYNKPCLRDTQHHMVPKAVHRTRISRIGSNS